MSRILCVDDEPSALGALTHILERATHTVVPARNAGEALHFLKTEAIDLIVSDFQLPGIDGIEFIQMLRRDRATTPVIMLTGFGSSDHAMDAVRAGAEDYLTKPFDPEHLVYRIEQTLKRATLEREVDDLRREVVQPARASDQAISLPSLDLSRAEEALIAEALRVSNNNRTHAAGLLGIGVRTLRKKLNAPNRAQPAAED